MNLQTIIDEVVSIPPAPQILPKLQSMLNDPDADLDDIVQLLKVDVSITAEILKLANSSYFGFANPISSLDQAISLIGCREIYRIVALAAADTAMRKALPFYKAHEGEFLAHSVATALIMTAMAEVGGIKEQESHYTIGLLHGIGKIVINQYFEARGLTVYEIERPGENGQKISLEDERALFGFDHTDAGAALLTKWKFSPEIISPIQFQHSPEKAGVNAPTTWDLKLSRDNAMLLIDGNEDPSAWILPEEEDALPFSEAEIAEIVATSHKKYEDFNSMMGSR